MGKRRGKRRAQRRQARRPEQGGGRPRGRGAPAAGGGASFDARAVGEVIDAAVAACFPHARAGPAGALVVALARGPSHPEGLALVDRALGRSLVDAVTAAWGRGWQPADLHRMVERTHGRAHARLSAVALGCEARGYADESVPVRWRQQLDAVGAEPPPEGDHRWAVPVAAARAGALWSGVPSIDDRADAVQVAVETLALIRGLPALPKLGPAPGEATVGRGRGRPPHSPGAGGPAGSTGSAGWAGAAGRASSAGVDRRILHRVTGLLAKAESTTYPDEAEALTAKAQELMTRHAIDAIDIAGLDSERAQGAAASGRRIGIDDPYARARVTLLSEVARANRCRAVWSRGLGFATVFGHEGDLDAVELLYTSLLVQATRAMLVARPPGSGTRGLAPSGSATRSFRQSFLLAYGQRIGDRLREVAEATAAEHAADRAASLLPVLARRADAAEAAAAAAFPKLRTFSTSGRDPEGWAAGRRAADRADLGTESGLGARSRGRPPPSLGAA
ncbi:MAG TPA: DUF2786 domain-containing protein [Acidimicrobiales bacterium]|nr:DUF2786 domain-containing protein [Acidimicrobiales bacterium]